MSNLEPLSLPEYLKTKYEITFQESWSDLEKEVRARHPEVFAMYYSFEEVRKPKKWWQIWK